MEDFSFLISLNAYFEAKNDEEALDIIDNIIISYFFPIVRSIILSVKNKIDALKPIYSENSKDIIKHSDFCLLRLSDKIEKWYIVSFDYETMALPTWASELASARIRVYKQSKEFYRKVDNPIKKAVDDHMEDLYTFYTLLKYWSSVRNIVRDKLILDLNSTIFEFRYECTRIMSKKLSFDKKIKEFKIFQLKLDSKILEYNDVEFLIKILTDLSLVPKLNNIRNLVNREVYDPGILDYAQEIINSWKHLIEEIDLLIQQLFKIYDTVTNEIALLVDEYDRVLEKKNLALTVMSTGIPAGVALLVNAISFMDNGFSLVGAVLILLSIFIILATIMIWIGGIWGKKEQYETLL